MRFAADRCGRAPSDLALADIDAELIGAFLDHLEADRANSIRSRNLRLTAIHSLFKHAALASPEDADTIRRVLAIPTKRADTTIVSYLTRVAELTALTWADVTFGVGANVHTSGKGRKERATPLLAGTARLLQGWARQQAAGPDEAVFATRHGGHLSTDAVKDLLDKHVAQAVAICPSLAAKRVTPHTLRHTCAMNLLQSGTDIATIALWLGHANTQATQVYLHADLKLKEQALARTAPTPQARARYKPTDSLLAYLESL